jgi:hypothetical protein
MKKGSSFRCGGQGGLCEELSLGRDHRQKREGSVPGRDNSECKGPGVEAGKVCSSKCKQAHVTSEGRNRSEDGGDGQKQSPAGPGCHGKDFGSILSVVGSSEGLDHRRAEGGIGRTPGRDLDWRERRRRTSWASGAQTTELYTLGVHLSRHGAICACTISASALTVQVPWSPASPLTPRHPIIRRGNTDLHLLTHSHIRGFEAATVARMVPG